MKPFLIALPATLGVAVLSYCFRFDRFDLGSFDLDFTYDDLATELWFNGNAGTEKTTLL